MNVKCLYVEKYHLTIDFFRKNIYFSQKMCYNDIGEEILYHRKRSF